MNDARWVVVLEAASPGDAPDLDRAELRQLMEEAVQFEPTALYNPRRYALQLRVDSFTAAEALFSASSPWREALRRTTVPTWSLSRAEVLTLAEYFRESELPFRDASRAAAGRWSPPALPTTTFSSGSSSTL